MNSEILFDQLGLSLEILKTIEKKGFEFASEIQAKSIPIILKESHDIVGIAQTGTGKTAAFGLPLIDRIVSDNKHVKCIILTPTRELANQVATELDSFKGTKRINILAVYGGQPIYQQSKDLRRGIDIVVGTPGRVMDMINRKVLDLSSLDYFVLDEADEMLNMGFIDDIEQIMEGTPEDKRVFLYSATMPLRIKNLSKKYMKEQVVLEVNNKEVKRENIKQSYFRIRRSEKLEAVKNIIELAENFHGIIFCQTKVIVNEVSDALKKEKLDADCIHGDINQTGRERILKKFKDRRINILIATDVAARGLDIDDLTHVINYSLSRVDSYVHRIGRTGRAGKNGIALTFIDRNEEYKINQVMKVTKNKIVLGQLPTQKEVALKKQERLITKLEDTINTKDTSFYKDLSKKVVQSFGSEEAVAALLFQINGPGVSEKPKMELASEAFLGSFGRESRKRRRSNNSRGVVERSGWNQSSQRSGKNGGGRGKSSGWNGKREENRYSKKRGISKRLGRAINK